MQKIFPMLSASLVGTVMGWLGLKVGLMTAYFSGVVGMGIGWYIGRRVQQDYFG